MHGIRVCVRLSHSHSHSHSLCGCEGWVGGWVDIHMPARMSAQVAKHRSGGVSEQKSLRLRMPVASLAYVATHTPSMLDVTACVVQNFAGLCTRLHVSMHTSLNMSIPKRVNCSNRFLGRKFHDVYLLVLISFVQNCPSAPRPILTSRDEPAGAPPFDESCTDAILARNRVHPTSAQEPSFVQRAPVLPSSAQGERMKINDN